MCLTVRSPSSVGKHLRTRVTEHSWSTVRGNTSTAWVAGGGQGLEAPTQGSDPCSATSRLCDLGQVTSSL